eukprot:gene10846-7512_t
MCNLFEKRREERRQQEQLKKEYNDELNRIAMERASSGPMNYLPSILVGLFFLAFPLGQEKIDWLIVSVTFIVNVIPLVALYSPSSWMNMFQMCLINLVVLHYAPFLYDAPDLVHQVRPAYFALFIGFNVLLSMSLYLFYNRYFVLHYSTDEFDSACFIRNNPDRCGNPEFSNVAPLNPLNLGNNEQQQQKKLKNKYHVKDMAPKKRSRDISKCMGLKGGKNVSGEEIDALTAEPLNPGRFLKVFSPDQSFCLCYNTSSLIKVAQVKGGFMQPPHFMEPMTDELVNEIQRIEGKEFSFKSGDALKNFFDEPESFQHQHNGFDQLIEEFYHLNPAEVFVCPYCYSHYLWTRFVPSLPNPEAWVTYMNQGATPPLDPLDVLDHMRSHPERVNDTSTSLLFCIVFKQARNWKYHMETHHNGVDGTSHEHRLRDVLCSYYSAYNHKNEEKFKELLKAGKNPTPRPTMTQQRYWGLNACYNKFRYNRVVDAVENVPNAVLKAAAFPKEILQDQYEDLHSSDSSFIVDEASSSDESYRGPRYSPQFSFSSDEDEPPSRRRKKASNIARSASTSLSSAESDGSQVDQVYDPTVGRWVSKNDKKNRDLRLLPEEHLFLRYTMEREDKGVSALYDPQMHSSKMPNDTENVDFEKLGESLVSAKGTNHCARDSVVAPPVDRGHSELLLSPLKTSGILLLDDDEIQNTEIEARPSDKYESGSCKENRFHIFSFAICVIQGRKNKDPLAVCLTYAFLHCEQVIGFSSKLQLQDTDSFDYQCGGIGCLLVTSSQVATDSDKETLLCRFQKLKSCFKSNGVVIVSIDKKDPDSQLLSWLSIDVGVAQGLRTFLCWSVDHTASFVAGLASTTAVSVEAVPFTPQDSSEPLVILRRSFAEVAQLLQNNDVVRLAHRRKNVAEFLLSTDADMHEIPGFGDKKMRRFAAFVNTPFIASSLQVQQVQSAPLEERLPQSAAQAKMLAALEKLKATEDREED